VTDLGDLLGWIRARPMMELSCSFFLRRTSKNNYTAQDKAFPSTELANNYAEKAIILAECGLLIV